MQAQQTALPTLTQEHYDLQSMENNVRQLQTQQQALSQAQQTLQRTQHKRQDIERAIANTEQQAEQLHDETDKAQQYYTQLETEVNRLQASLHPDWNTLDKVLARKQSVEQQMKALTTQLQNAEQRLNQARSVAAAANAL